jgi:putative ABC transport system substrate-binding protein
MIRAAAGYVDPILTGAKPAEIPAQQSTKISFVINLETALALKLNLAPALVALADEVIE